MGAPAGLVFLPHLIIGFSLMGGFPENIALHVVDVFERLINQAAIDLVLLLDPFNEDHKGT